MIHHYSQRGYDNDLRQLHDLEQRIRELSMRTAGAASDAGNTTHDNAAYEQLTEEIRLATARSRSVADRLRNAQIVMYPRDPRIVSLGSEVEIDIDGKPHTYRIVGYGESDGEVSILYRAPLAQAVIGKSPGETGMLIVEGQPAREVYVRAVRRIPPDERRPGNEGPERTI